MLRRLVGFALLCAASPLTYGTTDYACVRDCTQKGYQYPYCESACSYSAPAASIPARSGTFDLGNVVQQAEQIKAARAQREAKEEEQRAKGPVRQGRDGVSAEVISAYEKDRDAALAAEAKVTNAEALNRIKAKCVGAWSVVPGSILLRAEIAILRPQYQCISNMVDGWLLSQESSTLKQDPAPK